MPLVQSSTQHVLYRRKIQTLLKRILIVSWPSSSSTYRRELGRPKQKLILYRYCTYADLGEWKEVVRRCDKETIMTFLHFICENCQVFKTQLLRQYWKQFQMLREGLSEFLPIQEVYELPPLHFEKVMVGPEDFVEMHLLARTHLVRIGPSRSLLFATIPAPAGY